MREQLKAIRVELGEERDPTALAIEELRSKLDEAGLPEHARQRADDELRRLQLVNDRLMDYFQLYEKRFFRSKEQFEILKKIFSKNQKKLKKNQQRLEKKPLLVES